MGDKDISEKALEWLSDIFADIVNAYFAIQGIERTVYWTRKNEAFTFPTATSEIRSAT